MATPHDVLAIALLRCPLRNWTPLAVDTASPGELKQMLAEGHRWWDEFCCTRQADRAVEHTLERVEMMLGVDGAPWYDEVEF